MDIPVKTRSTLAELRFKAGYAEEGDERLALIAKARDEGRIIDDRTLLMPAERGKVCFSIEYDGASLNWNASRDEIRSYVTMAEQFFAQQTVTDDHRGAAREYVIRAMGKGSLNYDDAGGISVMATWLMFSGSEKLIAWLDGKHAEDALHHVGYIITAAGEGHNFRLQAG